MITRDKSRIVCGMQNGCVEMRRVSDLGLISCLEIHPYETDCICELEDGSFISASYCDTMKWWDEEGGESQIFPKYPSSVYSLLALNSDTLLAITEEGLSIWDVLDVSYGEYRCTSEINFESSIYALLKLSDTQFVTGSRDKTIQVWNSKGECIETIYTDDEIDGMARVGDSIIVVNKDRLVDRRLK